MAGKMPAYCKEYQFSGLNRFRAFFTKIACAHNISSFDLPRLPLQGRSGQGYHWNIGMMEYWNIGMLEC